MADWSVLPPHSEIQTSSPASLYSGCRARRMALLSGRPESLATLSRVGGCERSSRLNTYTDSAMSRSGFIGASAQKCLDLGWVFTKRLPAPGILSSCTTFQLCCLNLACSGLSDAVEISDTTSSPRCPVAHTGPYCLCMKFAPRPGWGILAVSTRAASLPVLVSATATLFDALAATMKYRPDASQPPSCRNFADSMVVVLRFFRSV